MPSACVDVAASLVLLAVLIGVSAFAALNSAIGGDYQGKECAHV